MDLQRAERIRADWKASLRTAYGESFLHRCEVVIDSNATSPTVTFVATKVDFDPEMLFLLVSLLDPWEWIRRCEHKGEGDDADLILVTAGQGSDSFLRQAFLDGTCESLLESPEVVEAMNEAVLSRRPPLVRDVERALGALAFGSELTVGPRFDGVKLQHCPFVIVLGAADNEQALQIVQSFMRSFPDFGMAMIAHLNFFPELRDSLSGREWGVLFGREID